MTDLTGQRFGLWTVLRYLRTTPGRISVWECRCVCGKTKSAYANQLKNGQSTNCGCVRREKLREKALTHGYTCGRKERSEYLAYRHARARCINPDDPFFGFYGGRGIEFRFMSFEQFINHIGPKPRPELTLDRIQNNGHYEIGNVRWATRVEQSRNTRTYI